MKLLLIIIYDFRNDTLIFRFMNNEVLLVKLFNNVIFLLVKIIQLLILYYFELSLR